MKGVFPKIKRKFDYIFTFPCVIALK